MKPETLARMRAMLDAGRYGTTEAPAPVVADSPVADADPVAVAVADPVAEVPAKPKPRRRATGARRTRKQAATVGDANTVPETKAGQPEQ